MKKKNIKTIYKEDIVKILKDKHSYPSLMAVPKLEKIVINRGLGEATTNQEGIPQGDKILPPPPSYNDIFGTLDNSNNEVWVYFEGWTLD